MNYQKFYKVTISEEQLRQAFLSYEGVNDLIAKTVDTLVTSMNYDEFLTMKYMLARRLLDGLMKTVSIPEVPPITIAFLFIYNLFLQHLKPCKYSKSLRILNLSHLSNSQTPRTFSTLYTHNNRTSEISH